LWVVMVSSRTWKIFIGTAGPASFNSQTAHGVWGWELWGAGAGAAVAGTAASGS